MSAWSLRSRQVPFRLTRNLATFFTAFGVEGIFITTLAVAAQVCCEQSSAEADSIGCHHVLWHVTRLWIYLH